MIKIELQLCSNYKNKIKEKVKMRKQSLKARLRPTSQQGPSHASCAPLPSVSLFAPPKFHTFSLSHPSLSSLYLFFFFFFPIPHFSSE